MDDIFLQAKTFEEWLDVYCKIYDNEIISPLYSIPFKNVIDDTIDNTGDLFKVLTKRGIVCFDSQKNIRGMQRAYISAYIHKDNNICVELNRYDGIAAFTRSINCKHNCRNGLYVTYDTEDITNPSDIDTPIVMKGEPFTHAGRGGDCDAMEILHDNMSDQVKSHFCPENFDHFYAVCTISNYEPNYLLELMVRVSQPPTQD